MVLAATLSACGLTRSPQTLAERTAHTSQRLDAASTPDARRAVLVALLAEAGLTPIAGTRFEAGDLVAGFVPGRRASRRDTLVVVTTAADGPAAAALVEAARLMVARADSHGDTPERSVLVALWPAGASRAEGLAAVRAFPLWSPASVHTILVLDPDRADTGEVAGDTLVASIQSSTGAPAQPDGVAARVLAAATAGPVRTLPFTD